MSGFVASCRQIGDSENDCLRLDRVQVGAMEGRGPWAAQTQMSDNILEYFGFQLVRELGVKLLRPQVIEAIQTVINRMRESGKLAQNHDHLPAMRSLGPLAGKHVELVFAHDCRNQGCNSLQCVLCKHNPNKRCQANFASKYWVGDRLLAKCEGEISVELIDGDGKRVTEDLSSFRIEVCILDGNRYNSKCREAGEMRLAILDECQVLLNQKQEPLLYSSTANNTRESPSVILKFQPGSAVVPLREVKVTESSESVLAGTKRPPFRLLVRAVHESGMQVPIRPAVSEEFVVVTKRTKNLKKQEIPSLDDPIAKLNHVGKETVKKLNELKASADEVTMELNLPPDLDRIMKVKDFLKLTRMSEADGHLQQKLKSLLKLSKEKWEAACEHAKTAVQTDNRMRAWFMPNMSVGLLYVCSLGEVRTDCPVALLQNRYNGVNEHMEVLPMEHQVPSQREQVQAISDQASKRWWEDSHPGWMIFTSNDKHFESLDEIIQYTRGGSRLQPVRQQMQQRQDGSQPYRGSQNEAGADSLCSEQSDVRGRQASKRSKPNQSGIPHNQSHQASPQHSGDADVPFGNREPFQQPHVAPNQAVEGAGGPLQEWGEPNPFRDRMRDDYPPQAARPPIDEGRWAQAPTEPPLRNWPDMGAATSFPADMLGSMASLNFPDLGSLPSLGVFGKDGLPQMNSLMFSDNPHLTKLNGMQSPGGHLPAGMKRKLDMGLPLSNSDEQHEGRVPI